MSTTDFCNSNWPYTDAQYADGVKSFPTVNAEVLLYMSDEWDVYHAWIDGQASNSVYANVPELTQSVLSAFQYRMDNYDGFAIRIKVNIDTIDAQDEGAAFCMYREQYNLGDVDDDGDFDLEDEEPVLQSGDEFELGEKRQRKK